MGRFPRAIRIPAAVASIVAGAALVATVTPTAEAQVVVPSAGAPDDTVITPQIVGGTNATEKYSFMVSLQKNGAHVCGGTLIDKRWVLTAKHCIRREHHSLFNVRVGSDKVSSGGGVVPITSTFGHIDADLLLLQLERDVTKFAPIGIAEAATVGSATRILGWGLTCNTPNCKDVPAVLQQLDTTIATDEYCKFPSPNEAARDICVSNTEGKNGACNMDSGGPALVRDPGNKWVLAGTTSRPAGAGCGDAGTIYVDVPAHRKWISDRLALSTPVRATPPPVQATSAPVQAKVITYDVSGAAEFASAIHAGAAVWNANIKGARLVPGTPATVTFKIDDGWPRAYAEAFGKGEIYIGRQAITLGFDTTRITAHEFGHILSLNDNRAGSCADIMSGRVGGLACKNSTPSAAEIAEVERQAGLATK